MDKDADQLLIRSQVSIFFIALIVYVYLILNFKPLAICYGSVGSMCLNFLMPKDRFLMTWLTFCLVFQEFVFVLSRLGDRIIRSYETTSQFEAVKVLKSKL